jgi:hypothetical protein
MPHPSHCLWFYHQISCEHYKLWSYAPCNFVHLLVIPFVIVWTILPSTMLSNNFNFHSSLRVRDQVLCLWTDKATVVYCGMYSHCCAIGK